MRIWIVHDSKNGTGLKISERLGAALSGDHEVIVRNVKAVSVDEILGTDPVGLVFSSPIRAGYSSLKSRGWLKKLAKAALESGRQVSKVLTFSTQCRDAEMNPRFSKIIEGSGAFEKSYGPNIWIKLDDVAGPISEGGEAVLKKLGSEIVEFFA